MHEKAPASTYHRRSNTGGIPKRHYVSQVRGRRGGLHAEVQGPLGGVGQQLAGVLEQHPKFGFRVRRPDVLHDPLTAPELLGDLHRRRPGSRPHPPDERHTATLEHHA